MLELGKKKKKKKKLWHKDNFRGWMDGWMDDFHGNWPKKTESAW